VCLELGKSLQAIREFVARLDLLRRFFVGRYNAVSLRLASRVSPDVRPGRRGPGEGPSDAQRALSENVGVQ
jgi:hypothetical protein